MVVEIFINAVIVCIVVITILIVGSIAVGFALMTWDSVMEAVHYRKTQKHWREEGARIRKKQLQRNISALEKELGISDNRRNT